MKKIIIFTLVFVTIFITPVLAKKAQKPSERAVLHNNQGVTALYKEDNVDRAIFEFKLAAELNPKYVEAWSNLGLAYKHKGRLGDAVSVLKKAIGLDKKFATPYNTLGTVYLERGDQREALKYFKMATRYNKKYSDAHYNSGLAYMELYLKDKNREHLNEAVTAFRSATEINSDHPFAHYKLATVYQELGKYEDAILRYKLALEIAPDLTDAWNSLAHLYTVTGQTLKAQQALNHALSQEPDSPESHMNMGLNYLKDNNVKLAIKEFNEVIKTNPTNEFAYFNVGVAYYQLASELQGSGKTTDAKTMYELSNQAYQSALKLRPDYPAATYNMGYNFQQLKDYQSAASWYQKTIAIDAKFYQAYFSLGMAYHLMGKTTEAAGSFCRFIKAKPANMDADVNTAKELVKSLGGC